MAKKVQKRRRTTSQKIFTVLSVLLIAVMIITSVASLFAH